MNDEPVRCMTCNNNVEESSSGKQDNLCEDCDWGIEEDPYDLSYLNEEPDYSNDLDPVTHLDQDNGI